MNIPTKLTSEYDPLDVEIGARLRTLRKAKGLSQSKLGEKLGVTFQQVQKYERGSNRISVSTMIRAAEALGVDTAAIIAPKEEAANGVQWGDLSTPGADELVKLYASIADPNTRRLILDLAQRLAG